MILIILASLLLSLAFTPLVENLSIRLGAYDLPSPRKIHTDAIPRLGGVAIFFASFLPIGAYAFFSDLRISWFMVALAIVFFTGLTDDIIHVGVKRKLSGLFIAISVLIIFTDIQIESIGNLLSFGDIRLGYLSIPFTFLAIVGVTNAINLIDGLDGLAGGISMISFAALAFLSSLSGTSYLTITCICVSVSILVFLIYNHHPASLFMGDSGSLYLGFCLSIISIALTQNPHHVIKPVVPVVVLAVPIFDALWVMGKRILRGKNPFRPDKTHIHHNLLNLGLSHKQTVYLLWGMTFLFSLCAILFRNIPSYILFLSTIAFCFTYSWIIVFALWKNKSNTAHL